MKMLTGFFVVFFLLLTAGETMSSQAFSTRQMGQACGTDATHVAQCADGLSCTGGTCEMQSVLSGASVSCQAVMQKAGVKDSSYSVAHGFCHTGCSEMYNVSSTAVKVVEFLLRDTDERSIFLKIAQLDSGEIALFQKAVNTCLACGDKCVMGPAFLGTRSGYY